MRLVSLLILCVAVWLVVCESCHAQNVSGYGMLPQPLLFLLREPAVHDDLRLSPEQKSRLVALNESFDNNLLATRNMLAEEGQKKVAEVLSETQSQVARILLTEQHTRLRQITYRLRGMSFVLMPYAAKQLKLSDGQQEQIEAVVQRKIQQLGDLQTATYQGKEAHQKTQVAAAAVRKQEQQEILKLLEPEQQQGLIALVGRTFDASRLGRVAFLAPDIVSGDAWINSETLQLKDLRGKVVALHFWAFG